MFKTWKRFPLWFINTILPPALPVFNVIILYTFPGDEATITSLYGTVYPIPGVQLWENFALKRNLDWLTCGLSKLGLLPLYNLLPPYHLSKFSMVNSSKLCSLGSVYLRRQQARRIFLADRKIFHYQNITFSQ